MAFGGMDYFSRLDEAKQQQYRDVYNKNRESGMGATDAMNAAQQHIMSLETPEAPETVPSANPTRTLMQNPFNTRRLLGTEVQSLFGTNRAPSQVTDQDRANAAWTPSQKTGLQYFEGLTDPTEISKFRTAYNNARGQGISPQEAAEQGKQAVEGAYQTLRDAANRNVLMDQAREDVNSVMGVDAYNKMDTADQDAVLNGWRDGGIDGIYAALRSMGSQQKYGIGEGWDPNAQTSAEEPENTTAEAALPAAEPEEELTPAQRTERAFENRIAELLEERGRGVSAERSQEIQRSLDVLYSMYDNYKAKQERENNPIYNIPEKPDTSEIDSRIEELYRQLGQAEADIRDSGASRQLTARRNAISSEIEKLQAERERLQAQYEEDRKNAEQTLMDQMPMRTFGIMDDQTRDIARGTLWNAVNSVAAGWHGMAGNFSTALAYGAGEVEKALGLSNAVSGYLKRGANYWRSMQGLAEKEANRGKETALQGVMYVLGQLTDPETAEAIADDARTATYWIQNHIVSEPFNNFGNILPGMFLDLMSGGANTAYNISRVGAEAAAAWGGRGLVQQLAGGVQAAMSNAGFGATFAGEFFGNAAEKIDNGEDITPTDAIWMMAGAYVNALIEYGGDDVASGFQALLRDDAEKGLKGFLSAEKGETIEELTQLFTGRVFENVSYALQHNGEAKYKLYSDEPGEALICLAEYWDTTWHTLISTGIMTGTHYTAGALRNAIVDINSGRTLSQEQIDCVREFTESMEALQEQEAQHNQFEESVTDPNSAYEQAAEAEAAEENIRNSEEAAETEEEIRNSEEAEAENEETARPAGRMSRAEVAAATMREYEDQHLIETAEAMALRPEYFSKDTQAAIRGEMARRGFAMPEAAQSFERTAQEIALETTSATNTDEQAAETPANATTEDEQAAEAAEEAAVEAEEEIRNSEEAAEAEKEIPNSGEAQEEEPRRGNETDYTPEELRSIRQEALERMTGEKTEENRAAIDALEELRGTVTEEPNPEPRPEEAAREVRAEAEQAEEQEGPGTDEAREEETDRALENAGTVENDTVEPDNRPDVPLPQERRGGAAEGQRIQAEEQEGPEAQEAQEESADRALEDGGTVENGEEEPGGMPDVPRPEEATGEAREVRTEQPEEQETRPNQEEQTEQIEQRNERLEAEPEEETEAAAREYGFKFGATNGREDTGVHLVSGGRRISQSQRQELKMLDTYAKSRGLSVEWYDSLPYNANGMYQGGNVIRLSAQTENPLSGVFGHELYHMIRQYSTKNAEQIEKLFDRWAAAHDFDTGARIEDIIDNYRRHGVELGRTDFDARAAAKEEVIANSMAYLWSDPEVARQMYAQDRTLLQRVLEWAKQVQQTIRDMLRRYADRAPEARFLEKADSDLSEVMRVVDEALRDMQALDDVKKTAGAVHGNDAATVRYERKVRAATSQREITHAARALAEDALRASGNEVNDANVTRMMYAAEAVHMGVLPYAAMKDNMLKYENRAGANRALQMLGNYVQLVKDQRNVDEFMALLSGEEQSGKVKWSLPEEQKQPNNVLKMTWDDQVDEINRIATDPSYKTSIPSQSSFVMGGTPKALRDIGFSSLPMTMDLTHAIQAINGKNGDLNHKLGPAMLKQLPELLENPIAVFASKDQGDTSAMVIVQGTVNGAQETVVLRINSTTMLGTERYDVNHMVTVQGRGNAANLLMNALAKENKNQIALYSWDKAKATALITAHGLQLPQSSPADGFVHNIHDPGSPVKMQYIEQTDTKQFRRWFGKSVVTENGKAGGKPLVVYHGTDGDFTVFNPKYQGKNYKYAEGYFFFTKKKRSAEHFMGRNNRVIEAYVKLENPYIIECPSAIHPMDYYDTHSEDIKQEVNTGEYDGFIIRNNGDFIGNDIYGVIKPTQIKSANNNIGTFDPNNPDIRYSLSEDAVSAGEEMAEERLDLAGGNSRTWDLMNSLRLRMADQKDTRYGQYRQHIAEMAREVIEQTGTSAYTAQQIEKELTRIFDEHEEKAKKATDQAAMDVLLGETINELKALYQSALSDMTMDEEYREVRDALRKGIYVNRDQVKEAGGAAEMRGIRRNLAGFTRIYTNEQAATRAGALWLEGGDWDSLQSINPGLFNQDMHWLERLQAISDFVSQHSDDTTRTDPQLRNYVADMAMATLAEYYQGSTGTEESNRTKAALDKANGKVRSLNNQLRAQMQQTQELEEQVKGLRSEAATAREDAERIAMGDKNRLREELKKVQAERQATVEELEKANKEVKRLNDKWERADRKTQTLKAEIRNIKADIKKNQKELLRGSRQRWRAQAKERAQATKDRQKIKALKDQLVRWTGSPTPSNYIPADKALMFAELIEAAQGADERRMTKAATQCMRKIAEMRASENYLEATTFDETFYSQFGEVVELLESKKINGLSYSELHFVADMLTEAVHQIRNSTKMIGLEKNNEVLQEAVSAIDTNEKNKGLSGKAFVRGVQKFTMQHLSPKRMFNMLANYGENAWSRQRDYFTDGQRKQKRAEQLMLDNFRALTEGENAKRFDRFTGRNAELIDTGLKDKRGRPVMITQAQRVSLYLHSLNEDNLRHFFYEATLPDQELLKKGKKKEAYDHSLALRLIEHDAYENNEQRMAAVKARMERLLSGMTEYEMQWVRAYQAMEKQSTKYINDTSMLLNGYEKATVEDYFPIKTDKNFITANFETLVKNGTLEGIGMLKERIQGTNPMTIEDVTDVISRMVNNTSLYYGMAIPSRNFTKFYNATLGGYDDSVKASLKRTWGSEGEQYLEKLMTDIQGNGRNEERTILDAFRSRYAGSVLTLNPSVMIKQAASLPTAAASLGWDPIIKALKDWHKVDVSEINKWTSAYREREGGGIRDMEANANRNTALKRGVHRLGNGIQAVDLATVRKIWQAAKYYVDEHQPGLKKGSDEYMQAVARAWETALEDTQPEYGVMQRPHILRSDNQLLRSVTMFKTQSMQNLNILFDAAMNLRAKQAEAKANPGSKEARAALKEAKTNMARAASSQIVSAVVLAVMTALGKAVLHKPEPYQDEKGEMTAGSVSYQLSKDMIGSMAGMVVGGSEIFELITGIMEGKAPYDIEAGNISLINDVYQSVYKLGNAAASIGDSSLTIEQKQQKIGKALEAFGKNMASAYGIPANNLDNIRKSAMAYVDDIISGRGLEGMTTGDVTLTKAAKYMGQALQKGDKDTYVRLYNRLIRQGKTQSQINSAMKSWMKTGDARVQQAADAIDSGDLDTYNRLINELTADGFGMANAVNVVENVRKAAAQSEDTEAENEVAGTLSYDQIMESQENGKDSVYTYAQMNAMLEQGNVTAAKKVQSALFKSKGTTGVKSALTNYWKPRYQEAYQARNRTELNRITRLMKQMGYSDSSINKWKSVDSSGGNSRTYKKKSSSGFGGSSFGSGFGGSRKKSGKRSGFGSGGFGG